MIDNFYYLIIEKNNLKKYFNKSLNFLDLKRQDLSWADGFYSASPYYLIESLNNKNFNKKNFALRINCSGMKICADIPLLIKLCDKVLDEGLLFSNMSFNNDADMISILKNKNNLLSYNDLYSNNKIIKSLIKYTNSLAVIGDINYNNSIVQIFPKNSRFNNVKFKLFK